jgi:hypothetical protein
LAHAVDEGQAFTDAASVSRKNEVEVEKDLALLLQLLSQLFHMGHLQLPNLVLVVIFQLQLFRAPTHPCPGAFVL